MKQNTFDRILLKGIRNGKLPGRTTDAKQWYRNQAKKVKRGADFIGENKNRGKATVQIGKMYFFKYDAKGKQTLPYWDAVPLIFPFSSKGKYFTGINFHYLPPKMRAILMDKLYSLANNDKFDESTKLKMSYKILNSASKYKYFQPAIKRYLKSHVKSKFILVESSEWDISLFLPLQQFQGASTNRVYADSKKKIKNSS